MSIFKSSVITHEQCIPHVAQAQHASCLQDFSRYKALHMFSVYMFSVYMFTCTKHKLGCELYR